MGWGWGESSEEILDPGAQPSMAQKPQGKRVWGTSLFAMGPSQMPCPMHTELLPFPKVKFTLSCRPLRCIPVLWSACLFATPAFPSDQGRTSSQGGLCPETEGGAPPGPGASLGLRPALCPSFYTLSLAPREVPEGQHPHHHQRRADPACLQYQCRFLCNDLMR